MLLGDMQMGFWNKSKCGFKLFNLNINIKVGQWVGTCECDVISMKLKEEMNMHGVEETSEDSPPHLVRNSLIL